MSEKIHTFIVDEADEGMRIDKYLAELDDVFPDFEFYTRSYIQKLIKDGLVLANMNPIKASYKVSKADSIQITIPKPLTLDVPAQNIPLDVVYEDNDLIVINKPKGMVVHPAAGHMDNTLVNALLYHCKGELSSINGVLRPGIVHRIDMNTTGLLVVCKNNISHLSLSEQLKEHSITRRYEAIVYNHFRHENGTVNAPIARNPKNRQQMGIVQGGKEAVTHYRVISNLKGNYSHIECKLETGRTHQIRVHMASIQHPLVGDTIYGPDNKISKSLQGQTLHARTLGFVHPTTKEYMEFTSPLPDYFEKLLRTL